MSTYTEIKGTAVINASSDPANPGGGQIFYNSTTGDIKVQNFTGIGAWASGGNLGTARNRIAGAGTQTAGLAIGGYPIRTGVEEYDGSSWTSGGSLTAGREWSGACGTQTAGLTFGGDPITPPSDTEEYDGSSWTAGGSMNTVRERIVGAGTQTAALGVGGAPPNNGSSLTEEYDGSAWTAEVLYLQQENLWEVVEFKLQELFLVEEMVLILMV